MNVRPPAAVEVCELAFRHPGAREPALAGVSFAIEPGQRVGLLGPNGAGKTTLMRLLCGYLPITGDPSRTKVTIAGLDAADHSRKLRKLVGYLPEQVPLYPELRVHEHLRFRAAVKGLPRRKRMVEVGRVAELVGLDAMMETTIGRLSRGYRQRVGIADALLGEPPLVVLDEPTVGLDPNQVVAIREVLRRLDGRQTLIFSSHVLMDVEALCDRILILAKGRVVADEPVTGDQPDTLRVRWTGDVLTPLRTHLATGWAKEKLSDDQVEMIYDEQLDETDLLVLSPRVGANRSLAELSITRGWLIVRMEPGRRRLEERFAAVTGFAGSVHAGGRNA